MPTWVLDLITLLNCDKRSVKVVVPGILDASTTASHGAVQ